MECQNGVEMTSKASVATFDASISAQVPLNESVLAEEFILTVGKALGLKPESVKHFGLFEGLLHPIKKFQSIDQVPLDVKALTFQKWCFNFTKETRLLKDPVAAQLIHAQTRTYIHEGLLYPSEELAAQLKENQDPVQYVTHCHGIAHYNTICIPDCRLHQSFHLLPDVAEGSNISLRLLQRGMLIGVLQGGKEEQYFVSWRKVQRWRKSEEDGSLVSYDVFSIPSSNCFCLCIQTSQANYLLAATIEMIKGLQSELKGPVFQTSDLVRNKDREVIEWNNIVYSETRFNAEREIAEKYVEVSMLR